MGSANCEQCDRLFTFDVVPKRGIICFRCHVKGVRIGFSHGKETFHGPTFSERRAEIERDAQDTGAQIERVGARWV